LSVDEQIAALKAKVNRAQLIRARSEAAKELAEKNESEAKARLLKEFGVDSPEAVHAKLAELRQDLDSRLTQVSEILDDINL
jgi:hypothetical protein